MSFKWPVRVYIEDTDAGGIVYYANYFRFFERARSEWLRSVGLQQTSMQAQGVFFVVKEASANYHYPAHLDDELVVTVEVEKMGKASVSLLQSVYRNQSGELVRLMKGGIRLACIDAHGRPQAIPSHIYTLMEQSGQEVS